jgi:hypothetical protein
MHILFYTTAKQNFVINCKRVNHANNIISIFYLQQQIKERTTERKRATGEDEGVKL